MYSPKWISGLCPKLKYEMRANDLVNALADSGGASLAMSFTVREIEHKQRKVYMSILTRGQLTEVRLGCVAALLLPIVCREPSTAYAYALHAKLVGVHGPEYSKSDVSRALHHLAAHRVLEAYAEDLTKPNGRIFYRPTWLAGFYLAMLTPKWDWPSFK